MFLRLPRVHAANVEGNKKRIHISQLDIYDNPEEGKEWIYIPEQELPLQSAFSVVRKEIWKFSDYVQLTTKLAKGKVDVGVEHSRETLEYVNSHPAMLPRATAISLAGLGGLVAARKGGPFKKISYTGLSMLIMASLCFPHETVAFTQASSISSVVKHTRQSLSRRQRLVKRQRITTITFRRRRSCRNIPVRAKTKTKTYTRHMRRRRDHRLLTGLNCPTCQHLPEFSKIEL